MQHLMENYTIIGAGIVCNKWFEVIIVFKGLKSLY